MSTTEKIELPPKILELLEKHKKEIVEEKKGKMENLYDEFFNYWSFFKMYVGKRINLIELLYILRPLIYLSTLIAFNKKSFAPLIINLIMDFIILKVERKEKSFEGQRAYFCEYSYRIGRLAVYLLRDPIYSFLTKPFVRKLMKILRLPTFITNIVMLLLSYYTNLYFIL
jgi:hypothetical protein